MAHLVHELNTEKLFIVYRLTHSTTRPGKMEKTPLWSWNDPSKLMYAEDASHQAAQMGPEYGIAVVITPDSGLACLDFDGRRDKTTGALSPLALDMLAMFPGAYVEVSVSGTGIHIWCRYTGPRPAHRTKSKDGQIELYTADHWIALGTPYEGTGSVNADHTISLQCLIALHLVPENSSTAGDASEWSNGPREDWRGPTDDEELIRRAMRSASPSAAFNGKPSFADLYTANADKLGRAYPDGNGRDYDASSADAALAQQLAFWTGNDCQRIERIMRRSALVRSKWETHGSYLERTILGAVARQEGVYVEAALAAVPPVGAGAVNLQGIEAALLQLRTQDSVAQIFALKHAGKLLYNHSRSKWLEWDGTRWKIENTQKAFDFARELSRTINIEGKSALASASFCGGVEQFAQSDRAFAAVGDKFDRDNYLLNTPAGTLDLRTGEMRSHNPADMLTLCTSVAPSTAGGAAFHKFISEITLGDRELSEFLQVSLGACLSGAVESHWLLFWIGQGRNGKNTLGDLVEDAMGDYARTVPTSTLMSKQNAAHPTELANLQGIRMALSSEVSDGEHWDESRIKQVTGDSKISARFMRADFFEFPRTHKHLIYGNHRPQLRSVDSAIKSRIQIVPFKASFIGREDADLPRRLREELGYVLSWLIEGHGRWLAAGKRLPACQAVDAESADYFASQSTPEMWVAERTHIMSPDLRPASQCPKSGELYRDYSNWKKDRGEQAVSQTRWAETMQKQFTKVDGKPARYRGLMLLPQVGNVPFPFAQGVPPPPLSVN